MGHKSFSGYGSGPAGDGLCSTGDQKLWSLVGGLAGLWPVHPPPYISFFVLFIFNVWEVKRLAASQTSNSFSPADIASLLVITKYDVRRFDIIT